MTSHQIFAELTDTLIRVIHQAVTIEQSPVDMGHGMILTASEIHVIDIAGRFPEENLKSLSNRLGVTKGAISQMVSKLEDKGYVFRVKVEENKKTIFLKLTQQGYDVFLWHLDLHKRLNSLFIDEISAIPEEQIIATIEILRKYEFMLSKSMDLRGSTQISDI